ncbi:MAG: aminodeoxychorismate synthase component I [Spirosomataceae bacterium]
MINELSLTTAIPVMNDLGKRRIPFLFIVDFLLNSAVVVPLSEINESELLYDFNNCSNFKFENTLGADFYFDKYPISFENYESKLNKIIKQLKRGDSFLANLSVCTKIETNLDLLTIFAACQAKYKLYYKDRFVCFSPETFVQVRGNRIASFPMKGTIDANLPRAAEVILSDQKEAAEHATIVDLIRNDLSMIAQKVWVARYRYLDRIVTNQKALLQVSSEIAGQMPDNWRETLGDWLFQLLPAGSISGAPKHRTLEIIKEAENYERGYYTGVSGIFDGENLDSGVLIRFIENTSDGLIFKSGGHYSP